MRKIGLIKDKNIESAIQEILKSKSRARIYLFLLKNNKLYPDTSFSGILSLIDSDMVTIAIIVFIG